MCGVFRRFDVFGGPARTAAIALSAELEASEVVEAAGAWGLRRGDA
jgi:hypothetical protein